MNKLTAIKLFTALLLAFSMGYAIPSYALTPSLANMMENFSKTIPELMRLATAISYVAGFVIIIKGIIELRHFGEMRTMMQQERGAFGPIAHLLVGAALIYLPSSVQAGISTFWADTSPLAYASDENDAWSELLKDAFLIFQFIGTIAVIRGLLILSKSGGRGGQQKSMGQAMTHIIGGIFCINMYGVLTMVWGTLALGQI
jgi:hypothetical protein